MELDPLATGAPFMKTMQQAPRPERLDDAHDGLHADDHPPGESLGDALARSRRGGLPLRDPMEFSGEVERRLGERLRQSGGGGARPIPFGLDRTVMELYWRVESQRADASPYLLQFVGPTPGSGTSTVASGYAVACAMASSRPVLLLGVTAPSGRPCILGSLAHQRGLRDCIESIPEVAQLYRASLSASDSRRLSQLPAPDLQAVLHLLRERFSAIVVDGPAVTESADSLVLSRHCDATVLVVRAEHSRRAGVRRALEQVERHGGEVLGTVLNRRRNPLPRWLDRWLS